MSLTKEMQKKISKIGTRALKKRIELRNFEKDEELSFAEEVLNKRLSTIANASPKKPAEKFNRFIQEPYSNDSSSIDDEEPYCFLKEKSIDEVISVTETPEEFNIAARLIQPVEQLDVKLSLIEEITSTYPNPILTDLPIKSIKEKKAKATKKSSKHEKKLYTDENGKEMTKSDLMRRLIRLKNNIKPKELNEQLMDAGFEKAYHSEIQRCRQQMGVTPEVKE